MEKLFIEGTEDTPEINFDTATLQFTISGRSLPEDVTSFYKPVINWLEVFDPATTGACFNFKFDYFNTASSKIVLDILLKIEDIVSANNTNLLVKWHYSEGDDDMFEAGEEYKDLVAIPFEIIQSN